ncbi:MAG TPA: ATP-binding protein [Candidatus Paceibacterota bacterium]|nr:ATP-binding protein [Candidatus Paceibacterota bacterium]HMO83073.1 ATP-binding protein [Candidatus Paceibacterota bacterium]
MNIADPTICQWEPAPLLFFSENIWGNFIYYSHLFPSLSGLIISLIVFINAPKSKPAQALLFTTVSFTIWSLMDLILWASDRSDIIMFVWSSLIYLDLFIYVGALYFIYSFFREHFLPLWSQLIIFALFIPLFLFAHTPLNLLGFDFTNCWREALEGPLWTTYLYNIELGIVIVIFALFIYEFKIKRKPRAETVLVSLATILFLLSFSAGNILGSIETDWEIGQIGLFGMPIFVALIAFAIVKYHAFKVKILAAEALMAGLTLLLVSQFFVRTIENSRVIAAVTLVLFIILGSLLINSVRKVVAQKEEIEKLAVGLEHANERLKILDKQKSEFVSIASHQLRSPLTAIRGYVSLIEEGNFGPVPDQMKDALHRISESGKFMAVSIDDFLNVSRIESGNMKYELKDINLREQTEHIVEDLRADATKRGLMLLFKTDMTGKGIVNADFGKTQQILHNLINNALKYTRQGSVTVLVKDDPAKKLIHVEFIDTGIGMSKDTLEKLFGKFARAKVASSANIMGTGLGLFVARSMARAMKGDVTAHSEGEGKGSRFVFTLPYVM